MVPYTVPPRKAPRSTLDCGSGQDLATRARVRQARPAKQIQRLHPAVLTHREVEQVMMQPDVTSPTWLRDRAMPETLYSTGIRRSELAMVGLYDRDAERGTLAIRQGKKDRMVPIGERAVAWIDWYLNEVRPSMDSTSTPSQGKSASQCSGFQPTRPLPHPQTSPLPADQEVLRHRGRVVTTGDVQFIRELIAQECGASRRELSRKLCEAWDWRQAIRTNRPGRFTVFAVDGLE